MKAKLVRGGVKVRFRQQGGRGGGVKRDRVIGLGLGLGSKGGMQALSSQEQDVLQAVASW